MDNEITTPSPYNLRKRHSQSNYTELSSSSPSALNKKESLDEDLIVDIESILSGSGRMTKPHGNFILDHEMASSSGTHGNKKSEPQQQQRNFRLDETLQEQCAVVSSSDDSFKATGNVDEDIMRLEKFARMRTFAIEIEMNEMVAERAQLKKEKSKIKTKMSEIKAQMLNKRDEIKLIKIKTERKKNKLISDEAQM